MASSVLMTGVGTVFAIDCVTAEVMPVSGAFAAINVTPADSQELTVESDSFEIRNGTTGAVDGVVYYNQRRTMSIVFTISATTQANAKATSNDVTIVPGSAFRMQVLEDTQAGTIGGTPDSSRYWTIRSATRTRSTGAAAQWRLDLIRYGDNDSVVGSGKITDFVTS